MEMKPLIPLVATLAMALPLSAAAADDGPCYSGGADGGRLEFTGAVEGNEFTGRFERFTVAYCMPPGAPGEGRIEVEVDLASAVSGNRDRDATLQGPEFFAVDEHPVSTWASTSIERASQGWRADGELVLKGIRADQAIEFTLTPDGEALRAEGRFVLAGDTTVDRQRFEVGTGEFADPEFVRNKVVVEFEVTLLVQP